MSLKVAAATYGCKVNQYETNCILNDFILNGFTVVDFKDPADIYIINTCTVTNRTDHKSRRSIRQALIRKAENNRIKVAVTGCYSQRHREEIMALGDVDYVIDNNNKNKLINILSENSPEFNDIFSYKIYPEHKTSEILDRSRAYIKIQDGCNYFCSYCAVPFGRGKSRSRSKRNIIDQINLLTDQGYREFVLGGVNLGLYGIDLGNEFCFVDLLTEIENISAVSLIRLSSLDPDLINDDLLNWFSTSKKLAPHFHIPLQSGSASILKNMKRHYDPDFFRTKVETIEKIIPDAAFGYDVIVGFPGETESLFHETLDFLNDIPFTYLHVFPFSKRPGTIAANMQGYINGNIAKNRIGLIQKLNEQKKIAYLSYLIDNRQVLKGIVENQVNKNWTALSDHYVRIYFESEKKELCGDLVSCTPERFFKDGLLVKLNDRN